MRLERTGDDADSVIYEYDDDNRLVKTTSSKDGETIYSYDGAGNLISKVGAGADTSYAYGVEGRLVAVREGGRLLMAATYDGDGNRTTQSSLYNRDRQLDAESDGLDGVLDIDLDSALDKGSVLRAGVSAFLLGIISQATAFATSVNPATIPWALDVMLGILIDAAPASEGAPHGIPSLVMDSPAITGKERDAIASTLGLIPKGPTSTEEVFDVVTYVNSTLTDNTQVMASVSTRSGTVNETYGIGRLATNTNGSATYFLNDGRGSVTQTASQQGKPTSWRSYSAFGEVEASSNLGDLPSYGYNAEEQHPRTGLTYMRFRYYEAKTSTFGVQDTYLGNIFSPLTLNRYLYCLANPVNYTDPSGHVSLREIANGIRGGLAKIGNAISKGISTIKRGLKNTGDLLRKVANKVSDVFNRALNKHKELGAHIVGSLLSNARKTIVALRNFYCGMSSFLAPIMKPITDALTLIINYTYQGVRGGVDLSAVAAEKGYLDGFLDFTLSAKKGDDGAYHIGQHYWQSTELIGYNDLYDMFLIEGSSAFGGGAQRQKYEFYYNGEKITLWTWKGDYLNLGAGSELGIYKGDYSGHTLTAPEYAMPMTLKVTNKVTGQVYTDYHPTENQWWVTGFNPSGHNTPVENLQSTVTIDFSSNPGMYEAFRSRWEGRDERWSFNSDEKVATIQW